MGSEINDLVHAVKRKYLDYRTICSLLESNIFQYYWQDVSEEGRKELIQILQSESTTKLKEVRAWFKKYKGVFTSEITIMELREIAKKQGVRNWSRMSKVELMAKLGV